MAAGATVRAATASPTSPARSALHHRHRQPDRRRCPHRSRRRLFPVAVQLEHPLVLRRQRQLRSRTLWRRQVRGARLRSRLQLHVARSLGEPFDLLHGLLERALVVVRRRQQPGLRGSRYGITTPYADLEPFAGVAYVSLHTDAMSETGGAAALQSGSSTQDNTFTTLGLRAAKGFAVNGGTLTASRASAGNMPSATPLRSRPSPSRRVDRPSSRPAPRSPATRPWSRRLSTSPRRPTSPSACIMPASSPARRKTTPSMAESRSSSDEPRRQDRSSLSTGFRSQIGGIAAILDQLHAASQSIRAMV